MAEEILISVIIPVYNSEQYLSRCLDSIIAQGFYEMILVDDGSSDCSGSICDQYAEQDRRIKVIHQTNKGVSIARNTALKETTGNWILFVDSDDWVEDAWISTLASTIQKINRNIDLIVFGFRKICVNSTISIEQPTFCQNMSSEEFVRSTYYNFSVCAYIFKKRIIDLYDIFFPIELKYSEDQAFILKYLSKCNAIFPVSKVLYNYYIHSNSTVSRNILTFNWALSNLIVANHFLCFARIHHVQESYYSYPVRQLYHAFFMYLERCEIMNSFAAQNAYNKEYTETINLYPDFKRQTTFRLAAVSLYLPKRLKFIKKIKNFIISIV